MSNKTQLQQNNIELQAHLQDILALPNVDDVKNGQYVWKELTAEGGTFRKYVVSDNESAYPDGGEKDGYWYEKANDLIGLKKLFGCNEICVETFTYPSNRECKYSIPHSLGKVPNTVLIANNGSDLSANYALISYLGIFNNGNSINGATIYKYTGGNRAGESLEGYITDSTITIGSGALSLEFYDAGVEYTLVTMA